jgi:hypothetical protein
MQNDYLVTIFSRGKGKTRTFSLDRRLIYIPLVALILLVVSCVLFGQAYFRERAERQLLEGRIALLEQLMSKSAERPEMQGGEAAKNIKAAASKQVKAAAPKQVKAEPPKQVKAEPPKQVKVEPEVQKPIVSVALRREEKKTAFDSRELGSQASGEMANMPQSGEPPAKIDDVKVSSLEEGGNGFRLDFKLINLIGEPLSGNVAIIASLKPPHQPRFVSFPSMQLVEGMPVRLRKSVGFNIRYFKYVTGRFYFPFSYSESFRILVYNGDEELILDSTLPAEEVTGYGLSSDEDTSSTDSSYITSNIMEN